MPLAWHEKRIPAFPVRQDFRIIRNGKPGPSKMKPADRKKLIWHVLVTVLGLACFPANPLVFAGIVKPGFSPVLFALGWVAWGIGFPLVLTPIIMFPKRGGVPKGRSFVRTTRLVDTGVYAIVRHPQYLGGILSIFLTTLLWYPHWLFAVLGTIGALVLYVSARDEDKLLIERYGAAYVDYMRRVPRMNILLGLIRVIKKERPAGLAERGDSLEDELWDFKDRLREGLLPYTRRAFRMLPALPQAKILDIGCGSGVPTVELARLSGGEVTGVDTDRAQLDRLTSRIEEAGLSGRVRAVDRSMRDLDFPDGRFDIIWAEGSVAVMGFQAGIREWRRFLKTDGFLVVHDDLGNLEEKLGQIPGSGYELLGHFVLNEDVWWNEYYGPLDKEVSRMRSGRADDNRIDALLRADQREIDGFRRDPGRYRSVFLVMKKV